MNEETSNQLSATEQPDPLSNSHPAVWEVVIEDIAVRNFLEDAPPGVVKCVLKDMADRDEWGRSKYKVPLQPFNGRDALVDMYQEFLDAVAYSKQYQLESRNDEETDFDIEDLYFTLVEGVATIRQKLLLRDGK